MLSNFKFKCSYTKPSEPHYFQQSSYPDSQITSLLCSLSTSGTVENLRSCNELSLQAAKTVIFMYCIAGKFGEFGELSVIRQTKTIQISTYNTIGWSIYSPNFLSPKARKELLRQTFPLPNLWRESLANLANRSWFAKLKPSRLVLTINNLLADLLIRQTFPLYCNCIKNTVITKKFSSSYIMFSGQLVDAKLVKLQSLPILQCMWQFEFGGSI